MKVITLEQLAKELPTRGAAERAAIMLGLRTAAREAERWIQWSIEGGGWDGHAEIPRSKKPKKPTTKKPKSKRGKRATVSRVSKSKKGNTRKATTRKATTKKATTKKATKTRGRRKRSVAPKRISRSRCRMPPPPAYRRPVDTGNYKNSFRTNLAGAVARNPSLTISSSASPAVKAGVIEDGRRRAPIPIEPLAQWVRRKFGCNDPKQARAIAYAISKSAAKRRRQGLKVMARAKPKIVDAARKALRDAWRRRPR